MFKTVKSKILAITIFMLTFLMLAFSFHVYFSRMNTKQLMVQNYKFSITASPFVQGIKNRIISSIDNLKSLALVGSLYYKTDRNPELTHKAIARIFENYPSTLGGGIWFKPYGVDKSKKYVCFYAFRDKNNKIIMDKNFESENYDYPNQEWYKQIISEVTPERNIVWSKPYYENQGSYTTMVTAGTGIYVDGELIGIATVDWELDSVIKEVGGDFYDFFFIDKTKFMFLIADVSGKGVPAALFMMTVKTLINNVSQISMSPKQLIKIINNKICQTNKQGFFVTVLLGITDINTGETSIINCGHNLPLIKRQNGKYEYLQLESNIALGVFEDSEFEIYETVLGQGDIIYTYTDGVTKDINKDSEVYGESRLCDCLNNIDENEPSKIAQKVKTSIQEYTDSNSQSDDITMLIYKYNGISRNIKTFEQIAAQENYKQFYDWLHTACKEWNLKEELANKLDMCAEEIFANISFYAYPEKEGKVETVIEKTDNSIIFEFRDEGLEYNPLEKPDPNIDLPPEERPLGGLGIFMVKKMADSVLYKRENGQNILTLIFKI